MNRINQFGDCHLHTYFSSDSDSLPEDTVKKALVLGLSSICFTEHNDFDYPKENGQTMFLLDFDRYINEIMELREQYEDIIPIYIGVEQGLQAHLYERINSFDNKKQLDFIIGSTHLIKGLDPYYPEFWKTIESPSKGLRTYFENILQSIKVCENFDVYGHIDYMIRYTPDKTFFYQASDYFDILDEILSLLIQKGKGIEINTSGFKYNPNQPNPCIDIIKRYRMLGGEIITVGSDAHTPQHLAYGFEKVSDILESTGFQYFTIFKNRKPKFLKL